MKRDIKGPIPARVWVKIRFRLSGILSGFSFSGILSGFSFSGILSGFFIFWHFFRDSIWFTPRETTSIDMYCNVGDNVCLCEPVNVELMKVWILTAHI